MLPVNSATVKPDGAAPRPTPPIRKFAILVKRSLSIHSNQDRLEKVTREHEARQLLLRQQLDL
jgi:hypothetical protein